MHYEHSTRSFLFQKSKENPVFHHMCPLSRVYLAVIDFYDSYVYSFINFVQAQKRRVGEAHVGPAGEQERTDGPAGRSHEAAEGTKLVGQQFGFISLGMYENFICLLTFCLSFFLHPSLSHRCLSDVSAFTHCHLSSSG